MLGALTERLTRHVAHGLLKAGSVDDASRDLDCEATLAGTEAKCGTPTPLVVVTAAGRRDRMRIIVDRVHRAIYEYQWVHLFIGILGNGLFIIGSVLFLYEVKPLAIYCFIAGSTGMLLGALGSGAVKLWKAKVERGAEPVEIARARAKTRRTATSRGSPIERPFCAWQVGKTDRLVPCR